MRSQIAIVLRAMKCLIVDVASECILIVAARTAHHVFVLLAMHATRSGRRIRFDLAAQAQDLHVDGTAVNVRPVQSRALDPDPV